MAEKTLRIPLQNTLNSRQETSKDNFITNGFIEQNQYAYVIKRPGISLVGGGAGVGNGIFYYNGVLYAWNNVSFLNPSLTLNIWSPTITYIASQVVYYYTTDKKNIASWTAVTPIQGMAPATPNWTTP